MGIVQMGPPTDLVLSLRKLLNINTFVETGTYKGGTALWASLHFDKVITIENSEEIHKKTKADLAYQKNISFIFGHSAMTLKNIISEITQPAIFWLDAHWSGLNTYGTNDECPILEELDIINTSNSKHVLMIDDARLFLAPPPKPHKTEFWPNIETILRTLSKIDRYTVVVDDVIISVSPDIKTQFVDILRNRRLQENKKLSFKVKNKCKKLLQKLNV